jgi:HAMP domain-containing protein
MRIGKNIVALGAMMLAAGLALLLSLAYPGGPGAAEPPITESWLLVLLWVVGAVLILSALLAFLLSRRVTVRLDQLAEMAEKMVSENPGLKLPVTGNDEISQVTATLNDISARCCRELPGSVNAACRGRRHQECHALDGARRDRDHR